MSNSNPVQAWEEPHTPPPQLGKCQYCHIRGRTSLSSHLPGHGLLPSDKSNSTEVSVKLHYQRCVNEQPGMLLLQSSKKLQRCHQQKLKSLSRISSPVRGLKWWKCYDCNYCANSRTIKGKRNHPPKILATQNGVGKTLWPYQCESYCSK